jgi:1-acyl-sn-glycerol-3-phosphate acyltransferase
MCPKVGALLLGNHTLYAMFDLIFWTAELIDRGMMVRGLGEHLLFRMPVSSELLKACGIVPGTRDSMRELMRREDVRFSSVGGVR